MRVNISKASEYFFPTPSLELVYFEAIANSIDAGASKISLKIDIASLSKPETFLVEITDNGKGFEDDNFNKFSKLLEVEQTDHKGIGRLVFLRYFKNIEISSGFLDKHRLFVFNGEFNGESVITEKRNGAKSTTLKFSSYYKERIKQYGYVRPESIKRSLLLHFYPLFYKLKVEKTPLVIDIELRVIDANPENDFYNDTKQINVQDLPDLKVVDIEAAIY